MTDTDLTILEPPQSHHGPETDAQIADRHWNEIVALVLVSTVLLIFTVVAGVPTAIIAAIAVLAVIVSVWIGLPNMAQPRRRR